MSVVLYTASHHGTELGRQARRASVYGAISLDLPGDAAGDG